MPAWGIVLIVVGSLVVVGGFLAALVVPAVGYALFTANKGACRNNLGTMKMSVEVLHTMLDSPIEDKWIEGFKYTDRAYPESGGYDTPCDDSAQKSRLAFWRMVADDRISERVAVGGSSVFLCPGSGVTRKRPTRLSDSGRSNRDFKDPANELFYSMFCQVCDDPGMVPRYGTRVGFVIMADRSPQDDGDPLAGNSANHRWGRQNTGQNVCYATGQVKWEARYDIGIDEDSIYECDAGGPITKDTKAGDLDDTVLMPVTLGAPG
jgi:hypothetical protein